MWYIILYYIITYYSISYNSIFIDILSSGLVKFITKGKLINVVKLKE